MFENNYNAESALKGVAKFVWTLSIVLTVLVEFGGFITMIALSIAFRYGAGWIGFAIGGAIMIVGLVILYYGWVEANRLWGFADIVGTVRRISEKVDVVAENTAGHSAPSADDELPEV